MTNVSILVRYPRFNELHEKIRRCQELSRLAGEPTCFALQGKTGAGKTRLVTTYAEMFPRYETEEAVKIPIFYVETPSPVTVKGMAAKMLRELGDPAADKGPQWSMDARLIHFIKNVCEVELVILDDFHHLIDKETNRILETVSDWLKVLIKETKKPFLVVGIDDKVEQILAANEQLARLFMEPEQLEPFKWDLNDARISEDFAAFILYVEEALGTRLTTEITRGELLHRLHCATGGYVGNIMKLMLAGSLPAKRQDGVMTLACLAEAFADRRKTHVHIRDNPFSCPTDQHYAPVYEDTTLDPPDSTVPRSRRRRKKGPSAGDVLKKG